MLLTDDRGIYRIYGIAPGRYRVSVGVPLNQEYGRMGVENNYLPITYHPGVPDESKARLIEVSLGSEITGVDITTGRVEKAYTVRGRVVDADTGKPMANQECGYGSVSHTDDGDFLNSTASGARSDDKGEFRIDGVVPGKYVAILDISKSGEFYSLPTSFEITDGDISGVEIKAYRGASISGTVTIEGLSEQEAATKFSEINLVFTVPTEIRILQQPEIKITSDGSFRTTGLQPGKAQVDFIFTVQRTFSPAY